MKTKLIKNYKIYPIIIFTVISLSISAMEIEKLQVNEGTPLIAPVSIAMHEEQNEKQALFDGSRLIYDDESKKRLVKRLLKKCAQDTCIITGVCTCMGCGFGLAAAGICTGIIGSSQGLLFCHASGGIFVEVQTIFSASFASLYTIFGGPICADIAFQELKGIEKIQWNRALQIPDTMWNAIDREKKIRCKTWELRAIQDLAQKKSYTTFSWFTKKRTMNRIINELTKRLQQRDLNQDELTPALLKLCRNNNDVVKLILNRLNLIEINTNTYLTEEELLHILDELEPSKNSHDSYILKNYAHLAQLANYGWISFEQSPKYPIRCELKYFDSRTMPSKRIAIEGTVYFTKLPTSELYSGITGPAFFLPFGLDLAQYYQFEKDPWYVSQYKHARSTEIQALLIEREKYKQHKND